jgi:hypothetical protein
VKTCAIMQPTYLPWSGYFNLMAQADIFVLLDDVQFNRRSWQTRNRILLNGEEHLLTVPVLSSDRDQTKIQDVKLAPGNWPRKHFASLTTAYGKSLYGRELLALLGSVYEAAPEITHLTDFNHQIIRILANVLAIETPLIRASEMACTGHRTTHLLNICSFLGCDDYLSPLGSAEYLIEDNFVANDRISLRFQSYNPALYPQPKTTAFVSHLSVVDVIAHQGLEYARQYVRRSTP